MQPEEILPTLVELSVAVAGFSGVVAALSARGPSEWTVVQRGFFSALLGSTAISTGVAVLAMVLLSAPVAETAVWAVASSAHLFFLVAIIAIRSREILAVRSEVHPASIAILAAILSIAAAQAANAAVLRAGWLCVAALGLYSILGFIYFVILVRQLWVDSQDA
jgi:hypothetical protein